MSRFLLDRMMGSFVGAIVGDALGSAYEFEARGNYHASREMEQNVFGLPAGSFTDDSSMLLCLAASLAETGKFDPVDQMQRYAKWRFEGYMSSSRERGCFDVGRTTDQAIRKFAKGNKEPYWGLDGEFDSGNGGIMRLCPVPIFFHANVESAAHHSALSSKVTHASPVCIDAAAAMGEMIARLLDGCDKRSATILPANDASIHAAVRAIREGVYLTKSVSDIKTTGYVIDTLESALWAFHTTNSFEDGMMLLAQLGGDVDTVCCVYGQIAGAFYGFANIPRRWVESLREKELVFGVADALLRATPIPP
jgi:ADP-ribosyl-[dinitrogen reductase] hydrolase